MSNGYKGYVTKANDHDQKASGFKKMDSESVVREGEVKRNKNKDPRSSVREGEYRRK